MPEFKKEESTGEGLIKLKTIEVDGKFRTSCDYSLKGVNTEGTIQQLQNIIDKLNKDLCSDGRKCGKCEVPIPNHFGNDLCWDCYNKSTEANKSEKAMEGELVPGPDSKKSKIEKVDYGKADDNPIK